MQKICRVCKRIYEDSILNFPAAARTADMCWRCWANKPPQTVFLDREKICAICQAPYNSSHIPHISITACGHVCHLECGENFIASFKQQERRPLCYVCRAPILHLFAFSELPSAEQARLIAEFESIPTHTEGESATPPGMWKPLKPGDPAWQTDASALTCTRCNRLFDFFHRKHHCRVCGHIICAKCSFTKGAFRVCRNTACLMQARS